MNRRLLALALGLSLAGPAHGQGAKADAAAHLFGPDKVWPVHLSVSAADWDAMHPTRGLPFFGAPALAPKDKDKPRPEAPPRGGFGFDFAYVKGQVEFAGKTFKDVAVRFKGNSTYAMAGKSLKRPFKIDLDRFVDGQHVHGLKLLNLGNNALDPSQLRESLGYWVFRAAGVPAPRTAFAEVYLTVTGKHEREFLGLYTLIENVDPVFLKNHFRDEKGMLLKPEGIQNLPYLGADWAPYEELYRPKKIPDAKSKWRLIEFTRLVNFADDAEFRRSVGTFLDVDAFLRYVAACSAMANLDSFVGFGHNYFLYLNPVDDRFALIPWDLNNTFGGLGMFGWGEQSAEWAIKKPHLDGNRLTERILTVEGHRNAYRKHLAALVEKSYTPEKLLGELDRMQKAVQKVIDREAQQKKDPKDAGGAMAAFLGKPADLREFVRKRAESLAAQLEGKSAGKDLANPFAFMAMFSTLGSQLAKPLREAADADKDGKLSRAEAAAALKSLFEECDKEKKGTLGEKALAEGLARLIPKRQGGWGVAPTGAAAGFGPGVHLAGFVFYRAADKKGRLTPQALLALGEKLFAEADRDKDGLLDERELTAGLNALPPVPTVSGRIAAPAAKK